MNELEYRMCQFDGIEVREENGAIKVSGTVVKYGDTATIQGGFQEIAMPGSVELDDRVIANRMHVRAAPLAVYPHNLNIELREDRVYAQFDLPPTQLGKDVAIEIERHILSGLSIEWRVLRDQFVGMTRRVHKARMYGVALVDRAAYKESTLERRFQEQQQTRRYYY